MSSTVFDAFDTRRQMTQQYISGTKLDRPQQPQPQPQLMHNNVINDPFAANPGMNGNNMMLSGSFLGNNGGMGYGDAMNGGMQPINLNNNNMNHDDLMQGNSRAAQRNLSIISFGGAGLRGLSFTSERASFGRAMSGLSALSIDWENMEDFDVNVDHSAHINNNGNGNNNSNSPNNRVPESVNGGQGGPAGGSTRRSSLRRSFVANNSDDPHVSFKV